MQWHTYLQWHAHNKAPLLIHAVPVASTSTAVQAVLHVLPAGVKTPAALLIVRKFPAQRTVSKRHTEVQCEAFEDGFQHIDQGQFTPHRSGRHRKSNRSGLWITTQFHCARTAQIDSGNTRYSGIAYLSRGTIRFQPSRIWQSTIRLR